MSDAWGSWAAVVEQARVDAQLVPVIEEWQCSKCLTRLVESSNGYKVCTFCGWREHGSH